MRIKTVARRRNSSNTRMEREQTALKILNFTVNYRVFELPLAFSQRLHSRLDKEIAHLEVTPHQPPQTALKGELTSQRPRLLSDYPTIKENNLKPNLLVDSLSWHAG